MALKKLTDLTACELSTQLKKAGLAISGNKFDEREALLRLTTHLIDKGEDPTSYEFASDLSETEGNAAEEVPKKNAELNHTARQMLLAKIVRLERSYFTQEGRGL